MQVGGVGGGVRFSLSNVKWFNTLFCHLQGTCRFMMAFPLAQTSNDLGVCAMGPLGLCPFLSYIKPKKSKELSNLDRPKEYKSLIL
jgi:hypothetical protein